MGGDHGAHVTVPAVLQYLARDPESAFVLVRPAGSDDMELRRCGGSTGERLRVQHAAEVVEMDEPPASALRGKKDSSMRVAINLVKKGEAQACVSAGNTGALMATARFVLKTLPGIDRPAIATILPTLQGHTCVLVANGDGTPSTCCSRRHGLGLVASLAGSPSHVGHSTSARRNPGQRVVKNAAELLRGATSFPRELDGDDITGHDARRVCDGSSARSVKLEGLAQMRQDLHEEFSDLLTKAAGLSRGRDRAFKRRWTTGAITARR